MFLPSLIYIIPSSCMFNPHKRYPDNERAFVWHYSLYKKNGSQKKILHCKKYFRIFTGIFLAVRDARSARFFYSLK